MKIFSIYFYYVLTIAIGAYLAINNHPGFAFLVFLLAASTSFTFEAKSNDQ